MKKILFYTPLITERKEEGREREKTMEKEKPLTIKRRRKGMKKKEGEMDIVQTHKEFDSSTLSSLEITSPKTSIVDFTQSGFVRSIPR